MHINAIKVLIKKKLFLQNREATPADEKQDSVIGLPMYIKPTTKTYR